MTVTYSLDGRTFDTHAALLDYIDTRPPDHTAAVDTAVRIVVRRQARAEILTEAISGDEIDEVAALFPRWVAATSYTVDDIARYDGTLYRCVQAHTSQLDWAPDAVPALWTPVRETGVDPDPWVQPSGAHDAYQIGDRVAHDGSTWVSTIDSNVWEPGVAGWTEAP